MNGWWTAENLYPRATEAAARAKHLEEKDPSSQETRQAFRVVSITEELIVGLTTISPLDRNVARKNAVRSAIKAGDIDRALMLIRLFESSLEMTRPMKAALKKLLIREEKN